MACSRGFVDYILIFYEDLKWLLVASVDKLQINKQEG